MPNTPNTPILRIIPSAGKKLADVARNVELLSVLSSTLLFALVRERPEIKDKVIAELQLTLSDPKLTPHYRELYNDALDIIKNLIVTA
jgi:hypothetical protein